MAVPDFHKSPLLLDSDIYWGENGNIPVRHNIIRACFCRNINQCRERMTRIGLGKKGLTCILAVQNTPPSSLMWVQQSSYNPD